MRAIGEASRRPQRRNLVGRQRINPRVNTSALQADGLFRDAAPRLRCGLRMAFCSLEEVGQLSRARHPRPTGVARDRAVDLEPLQRRELDLRESSPAHSSGVDKQTRNTAVGQMSAWAHAWCGTRPQNDREPTWASPDAFLHGLAQSLLLRVSRGRGSGSGGPEGTELPSALTRRLLDSVAPLCRLDPPPAGRGLEVKHEGQALGSARTRGDGICLRSPRD